MASISRSDHRHLSEVRAAIAPWLARERYDWFLTGVVEDGGGTPDRLRRAFRHARNVTYRDRFGPRWAKPRYRHRYMTGLYVIEGLSAGNGHVHAALRFDTDDPASFERSMDKGWRKIVYRGDIIIKPFNADVHSRYIVKDLGNQRAEDLWGFIE